MAEHPTDCAVLERKRPKAHSHDIQGSLKGTLKANSRGESPPCQSSANRCQAEIIASYVSSSQ
eukprot:450964-Amphidinium_carterae.1